jgi:hypothetical protein
MFRLAIEAIGDGTNIFLCELDVLDVCILVLLARTSRCLDILREVHICLGYRSTACGARSRHWKRLVAVMLGRLEKGRKADPAELLRDPLEDRRRHEVDIDPFSLAPRHLDDLSPYHAPRVEWGAFAGGVCFSWVELVGVGRSGEKRC